MIYDHMERLVQYKGLNPNLDTLIDHVLSHGADSYAPGRNEVDGDNGWISCNTAELSPKTDLFERHKAYIDLQIPLEVGEIITVSPMEALTWEPSEAETIFTHGPAGTSLHMVPGMFAIFFPGDAHNCGISANGEAQTRKLVGKAHI